MPNTGQPLSLPPIWTHRCVSAYDPDESALLIAFEVEDDDVQISTRPDRSWDTEDGVEVHLDLAHNGETIRQFALRGDGTKRPASG